MTFHTTFILSYKLMRQKCFGYFYIFNKQSYYKKVKCGKI